MGKLKADMNKAAPGKLQLAMIGYSHGGGLIDYTATWFNYEDFGFKDKYLPLLYRVRCTPCNGQVLASSQMATDQTQPSTTWHIMRAWMVH